MLWFAQMVRTLFCVWPDRHRQRYVLRNMDDGQLRDLGISRSEAMREGQKTLLAVIDLSRLS